MDKTELSDRLAGGQGTGWEPVVGMSFFDYGRESLAVAATYGQWGRRVVIYTVPTFVTRLRFVMMGVPPSDPPASYGVNRV